MWNSCAKFSRLKKALEYRGLDPKNLDVDQLSRVLKKRGITDAKQNPIVWGLLDVLEPPGCQMSHCKFYGNSTAFCNCGDGRLPSKCDIYRDYKNRCKEREQKRVEQARKAVETVAECFQGQNITKEMVKAKLLELKYDIDNRQDLDRIWPHWQEFFEPSTDKQGWRVKEQASA